VHFQLLLLLLLLLGNRCACNEQRSYSLPGGESQLRELYCMQIKIRPNQPR